MAKGLFKSIVGGIIGIAILGGVAVGGYAIGKHGLPEFDFGKEIEQPDNGGEPETAAGNGLIVTPASSNRMKLTAKLLSTTSESEEETDLPEGVLVTTGDINSYVLTATLSPANIANTGVDWVAAWKNSSSSWAQGKNVASYVTVTPSSYGALTATVECKQAFGEQVIITVVSRENSDITAECVCDYTKKITGFTFVPSANQNGNYATNYKDFALNSSMTSYTANKSIAFFGYTFTFTYSAYTVDDTFSHSVTRSMNKSFAINIVNQCGAPTGAPSNGMMAFGTAFFYCSNSTVRSQYSYFGYSPDKANQAINLTKVFISRSGTDNRIFTLKFSFVGTHTTTQFALPVYFAADSLPLVVQGASLDYSSLMF